MKNIILIDVNGEQLISSTDDGTNSLYINDVEIPSSNWVGTGNYTDTINGHAITIAKVADLTGNVMIQKVSEYNYKLTSLSQLTPVYQDQNGNVVIPGILTLNGQILFDTTLTDIRGQYTDGKYRDILQAPNNNNNVVIGHGGYKDEIGATNIYGNAINLVSKEGIVIDGVNMGFFATSSIEDIITVDTSIATITSANYLQWGKMAQLRIIWTNKNAISVPANGNITNITIGTLISGKRPKIASNAGSQGDNAGASWYSISTGGSISLGAVEGTGAARTIAAGTTFSCYTTFMLAGDTSGVPSGDPGGVTSYIDLTDKPSIEGVTLIGDKTHEQLNLQPITNTELEELLTL